MAVHTAIVTVNPRSPLETRQVPTPTPKNNEVLVRSEWTASTPLDLHQNDGHLLVTPPQILGDGVAGTVIQVGSGTTRLKENDKVFGFVYQNNMEKAHQEIVCVPENLLGLLPDGFTMQEAVTVPNNFVTVFYTVRAFRSKGFLFGNNVWSQTIFLRTCWGDSPLFCIKPRTAKTWDSSKRMLLLRNLFP